VSGFEIIKYDIYVYTGIQLSAENRTDLNICGMTATATPHPEQMPIFLLLTEK
jgi:hypothetical protein